MTRPPRSCKEPFGCCDDEGMAGVSVFDSSQAGVRPTVRMSSGSSMPSRPGDFTPSRSQIRT
jgi:hypothetical protein